MTVTPHETATTHPVEPGLRCTLFATAEPEVEPATDDDMAAALFAALAKVTALEAEVRRIRWAVRALEIAARPGQPTDRIHAAASAVMERIGRTA